MIPSLNEYINLITIVVSIGKALDAKRQEV